MKKRAQFSRFVPLFILFAILVFGSFNKEAYAASKPLLQVKKTTICVGNTTSIKIKNVPKGAKITYKSKNKVIATVNKKGRVTGKKVGQTKIAVLIAKKGYKKSFSYTVKVVKPLLKQKKTSLKVGQSKEITFKYKPGKKSQATYKWTTSNKRIVRVSKKGRITAVKSGTATISVKVRVYKKSYTLKHKVIVKAAKSETAIELSETTTQPDSISKGITENEFKTIKKYDSLFANADKKIQESDGDDTDAKIQAVYESALEGKKTGDIKKVEKNKNGVSITFESGIHYIYQPVQEGMDASGLEATMDIVTMQPYWSEYSTYDKKQSKEGTDDAANKIASKIGNYHFTGNYDNGTVTIAKMKNIGSNQIVLFHSHGYYDPTAGSILWLGETGQWEDLKTGGKYAGYKGLYFTNSMRYGISSDFITDYCGNMKNTFLYLGTCYSGKDSRLANSFLKKGATAVIGNSESIYRGYNCDMMEDVIDGLLMRNDTTKKYNTLTEALMYAKGRNGENDLKWAASNHVKVSKTMGATPVIYGNQNYRLSEATPSVATAQSISLSKSSLELGCGGVETLSATILPLDAVDKTITWSTSDPNIVYVDNGLVFGIKNGTAVITAKTVNGKTATCQINVVTTHSGFHFTDNIEESQTTLQRLTMGTGIISGYLYISDAYPYDIFASSNDPSVVSIEGDGRVDRENSISGYVKLKANKVGEAIITLKGTDGQTTSQLVYVVDKVESALVTKEDDGSYQLICTDGNSSPALLPEGKNYYIRTPLNKNVIEDTNINYITVYDGIFYSYKYALDHYDSNTGYYYYKIDLKQFDPDHYLYWTAGQKSLNRVVCAGRFYVQIG